MTFSVYKVCQRHH